ncbi:MAG TPA: hypothetical protein VJB89_03500 [Candidatus Nanoarchaeia archaeon]|nr:hypothetical protein [Candidatus Nanoarchaeia archaeon]
MDLEECKKLGFIRITNPNKEKTLSLIEISDIKEETINTTKLNGRNINAYVPLAYDSLREILEALCILFGYNITNHICLGELLKELIPEFDYNSFDRFRYIRNGINYYGKQIGLEEGKEVIDKIFLFRKNIKKLIFNKFKE